MRKVMKYYPLDTDPIARAHVVIDGNRILFEDHMGYRFALSSRRIRRIWHAQGDLYWDCVGHYKEVPEYIEV